MDQQELRDELLETARRMNVLGINHGTSGNVSTRIKEGYLITPTGMPYEDCMPDDMVEMSLEGEIKGVRRPSSEWRFHHDIYVTRTDVGAIVHTHSTFATTLACLGIEIPAFHYMVAAAGGNSIACAEYATFGTQELSDNVLAAMEGRKACLMANHGMIATGKNLKTALALAVEVENLARVYWQVLQAGGGYNLSDAEMSKVLEKFGSYGQQS